MIKLTFLLPTLLFWFTTIANVHGATLFIKYIENASYINRGREKSNSTPNTSVILPHNSHYLK
jgi:hypothetical protein